MFYENLCEYNPDSWEDLDNAVARVIWLLERNFCVCKAIRYATGRKMYSIYSRSDLEELLADNDIIKTIDAVRRFNENDVVVCSDSRLFGESYLYAMDFLYSAARRDFVYFQSAVGVVNEELGLPTLAAFTAKGWTADAVAGFAKDGQGIASRLNSTKPEKPDTASKPDFHDATFCVLRLLERKSCACRLYRWMTGEGWYDLTNEDDIRALLTYYPPVDVVNTLRAERNPYYNIIVATPDASFRPESSVVYHLYKAIYKDFDKFRMELGYLNLDLKETYITDYLTTWKAVP